MKRHITLSDANESRCFFRGMPISGDPWGIVTEIDHQRGVLTVRDWRWYDHVLWPARKAVRWIGWRLVHTWLVARYWYYHAKWLLLGDR